jgi:hypothetical protein
MKSIKKYLIYLMAGSIIFLQSCAPDDEELDEDPRLKFGGTWVVNENSSVFGSSAYQVTITNNISNDVQIQISNFYNLGAGTRVNANISGNNMTIPLQNVSSQSISGSGSFQNNTITASFSANDGQVIDNVTAQFTRP